MVSYARRLDKQVREFAQEQQDLLNATITTGIRLSVVMREDRRLGWIGYRIAADQPAGGLGIPIKRSLSPPGLFLVLQHTLVLDYEGKYLTVSKSSYGLYADARAEELLLHYDYVRDNQCYPEAHVQVEGSNAALDEVFKRCGRTSHAALRNLHLPVGDRRYRPTLEDVIEFLIVERLVAPVDGWKTRIAEGRARFAKKQLRAAVRRAPGPAADQLAAMGWIVQPPAGG